MTYWTMASSAATVFVRRMPNFHKVLDPHRSVLASLIRNVSIAHSPLNQKTDMFQKRLEESWRRNPIRSEEVERLGTSKMAKKNRMYAQFNYIEWRFPTKQRPIDISCTRGIIKEYEAESEMFSNLRQPRKLLQEKRAEFFSHRAIKKKVKSFHRKRFPVEAQEIYLQAHNLLNSNNWTLSNKEATEDRLHGLVTEFAYLKMIEGLETKSVNWKFVESIEPPRTVQTLISPMMHEDNLYAQVTVRFHTRQILSLHDRFGRLMLGSPTEPRDLLEFVTFERHIVDPFGKWRIHGKNLVQNKNTDNTDKTMVIVRKNHLKASAEEWHKKEEEECSYKWYPTREKVLARQNRPFTRYRTKKQRRSLRKHWVTKVLHKPIIRMRKKDLRRAARKSKRVYEMRQTGALPKPPP